MDHNQAFENRTFDNRMEALAGQALEILPRMAIASGPSQGLFCERLRPVPSDQLASGQLAPGQLPGQLEQIGVSPRYTIMTMIGVSEALGAQAAQSGAWKPVIERLRAMALQPRDLGPGNLGLMLWLDAVADLGLRSGLAPALSAMAAAPATGSMQSAWILMGAVKAGLDAALLRRLYENLMQSYRPQARMFVLGGGARSWRGRFQSVLGSFASQVYPLLALSVYGQSSGERRVLSTARAVADRVCELQGPAGEWFWIVDTRTSAVYLDYPVYSVHQDAMAPMGLLAAAEALGDPRYVEHAARGVAYLFDYREARSQEGFFDARTGLIRRAVVRDYGEDPAGLPFGVSSAEMAWMRKAILPACLRGRLAPAEGFRFVTEARPYCLGWILHAAAQTRACTVNNAQGVALCQEVA